MAKAKVTSRKKQNAIVRYFRETMAELRKVSWPTREEATQLTVIVLVVVSLMSAFLALLDLIFSKLFAAILSLG